MVSPTLTRKLFAVDMCWEKENHFSPVQCHRVCQLHSRTDPVPKQEERHGFVHGIFFGLVLAIFVLLVLVCVF